MKKFLVCLVLSLFVMSSMFAVSAVGAGTSSTIEAHSDDEATVNLTLDIAPSEMFYYTFGFTNDAPEQGVLTTDDKLSVPDPAEATAMKIDPATSIASNVTSKKPLWFYYKAKTTNPMEFTLTIKDNMIDGGDGGNAPLGWKITVTKEDTLTGTDAVLSNSGTIHSDSSEVSMTATVTPTQAEGGNIVYGLYKIVAETDVIPLLSSTANYSGTLGLTIAPVV